MKINLIDDSFKHDDGIVAGKTPYHIEWDRTLSQTGLTVYTNKSMWEQKNNLRPRSAFLLSEPTTIIQYTPELVAQFIDNIEVMFTHDSRYLNKWPDKTAWINGGGIWIGGKVGRGTIGIKEKNKKCSLVASYKVYCPLHYLRAKMAERLRKKVDVFGTIQGEDYWVPIHKTLDDYYYSIIIENHIDDLYFTEKLLNCFATGTIPIYIGARKLGRVFNEEGVIQLPVEGRDLEEILLDAEGIVEELSVDYYHYKLPAVMDNFDRCQKFETIEDFIYTNYKGILE